jgi:hypothetical protein
MEEIGAAGHNRFVEEKPMAVGRQPFAKGTEEPVRAIAELELGFRVCGSQAQQNLAGVDAYSRELVSDAISGVESDRVAAGS